MTFPVPALLTWFRKHQRAMPWRSSPAPYAVWISEIMLQQTQVATVIPYFTRFIRRFPSPAALARAPLESVLKLWQGLGYYSRARHLQQAATHIVRDYQGQVPSEYAALRSLPGIGDYTAGAILSIAFGQPYPAVDGNVVRVCSRVWGLKADRTSTMLKATIRRRLEALIPSDAASDFTQALMEVGALVCRPRAPMCGECPFADACKARRSNRFDSVVASAKPIPKVSAVVGLVERNGKILIARRRIDQMLGGLWELPGGKIRTGESKKKALIRELREETGLVVDPTHRLPTVVHTYSHFQVTLYPYVCRPAPGRARALGSDKVLWCRPDRVTDFALPKATEKILQAYREWMG